MCGPKGLACGSESFAFLAGKLGQRPNPRMWLWPKAKDARGPGSGLEAQNLDVEVACSCLNACAMPEGHCARGPDSGLQAQNTGLGIGPFGPNIVW